MSETNLDNANYDCDSNNIKKITTETEKKMINNYNHIPIATEYRENTTGYPYQIFPFTTGYNCGVHSIIDPAFITQPAMVMLNNNNTIITNRNDFSTGLCECWTDCNVCFNATFCPWLLAARMQNMMYELAEEPNAIIHGPNGSIIINNMISEQIAQRINSYNCCCILTMLTDIGRYIGGAWCPELLSSLFWFPGTCLQNISVRSMVRNRLQIMPHQMTDVAVNWCCISCAIGQQYIEMARYGIDPLLVIGTSSKAQQFIMKL
jgi:Cys-rich protein (TIGR01571 family)